MGDDALTTEQEFIVKRLMNKIGATKHHLHDAVLTAKATSPEVLVKAGFSAALRMIETQVSELRRAIGPVSSDLLLRSYFPPRGEEKTDG